ncbi:Mor transcription activator family protein [Pararhodospirillum photometricum]|uniref:Mor transcription activator domain-containing protein n=1 Tax=Pararhodospirillum photometricum DSM 122 TaxID=1150469 RepID=H6SSB3_PARPM|nr:Mor transcription activator family protein [Pararhodospirillum photometricum]CCG07792.1 unnamed protein product [Pararhodospirillum photometricum DSM 122]
MLHDAPSSDAPGTDLVFSELMEYIGEKAVNRLVDALGGTSLYIAKGDTPNPILVQALGQDDAARFCQIFSGERVRIPSRRATRRRERVIALRKKAGWKIRSIALDLGLSEGRVYQILQEARRKATARASPSSRPATTSSRPAASLPRQRPR